MDLREQVAALTGAPPPVIETAKPDPDEWSMSKDDLLHLDEAEQANIGALIDEAAPAQPQAPPAAEVPVAPPAVEVPTLDLQKITADKAALDTAFASVRTKFEDGEIDGTEFNRQLAAYNSQVAPLLVQEQTAAQQQRAFEDAWDQNVGSFMGQRGFLQSPAHVAIFDKHLIDVGTQRPQSGQAERMEWAYGKMVADAVAAGLPIPRVSATAPQVGIAPTPSAVPPNPADNQGLGGAAPTLHSLPHSMESGTGTGQFAHLQALIMSRNADGYAQAEQAMSRMTEEQMDSFLMHG